VSSPVRALVPVKPLHLSKLRLAELLTPAERAQLTLSMLEDVLNNLAASEAISDTVIVTRDPDVVELAKQRGVGIIAEAETIPSAAASLNDALTSAARQLEADSVALLVVPGDVPLVGAGEYTAAIQAWTRGVVAVAAQDGGTNAMLSRSEDAMPYCFGPNSIVQHRSAAVARDLEFNVISSDTWSRDIDVPADVVWLAQQSERFVSVQFAKRTLRAKAHLRRSA
jgi:2-phospho-L-lactate guanylyltransferase